MNPRHGLTIGVESYDLLAGLSLHRILVGPGMDKK
jgi:hypothetical protein